MIDIEPTLTDNDPVGLGRIYIKKENYNIFMYSSSYIVYLLPVVWLLFLLFIFPFITSVLDHHTALAFKPNSKIINALNEKGDALYGQSKYTQVDLSIPNQSPGYRSKLFLCINR